MLSKEEKVLKNMCLMDDTFMTVALDGNTAAISILVSTVLKRKIRITSVVTQRTVINAKGKKIIMDVFAVDDHGNVYVIEVENNPTRAKVPRMQYYSDMVSNIIVQSGTTYSQIPNRTVICFTRGDGAKTGQSLSRSVTKWKNTDQGVIPYGEIIYVNVKENQGNDPISVLCRDLVQKDYRKIVNPVLRESCRRTKKGDRKEIMCDKIRQLQAETRKEERARAAKREKKLKMEIEKANKLAEEQKKEAERANMLVEEQKKETDKAKREAKRVKKEAERQKKQEAERLKKEVERARQEAEQERNNYLRGMIEAHIPLESICAVLHMSVDAVRKQASLLGCVL